MENEVEIWKEIPTLEGRYSVSTFGRVVNMRTGVILKLGDNGRGYKRFETRTNKFFQYWFVHRAVMLTFCSIDTPERYEVNHLDFNPSNNRLDNLQWALPYENRAHSIKNNRYAEANKQQSIRLKEWHKAGRNVLINKNTGIKGEMASGAKLTNEQVIKIKELTLAGKTRSEIGRLFGVSHKTISNIALGNTWAHIHIAKEVDL